MARGVDQLRQTKQQEVTRQTHALAQLALEVRSEMQSPTRCWSHALLRRADAIEGQGLRSWLEQRQEDATRTIDDFDRLNSIHNGMNYVASRRSQNDACQRGYDLAIELSHKMPQAQAALHRAMESLPNNRELAELPTSEPSQHHHCVACGHEALADSCYCCNCGALAARSIRGVRPRAAALAVHR